MKTTKKTDFILQITVTLIALIAVAVCMPFHEPWFDEAQAYLISRDASLHDILFLLPHYEGHPPLWHLILKFAIMFGLPYEMTIKLVQYIMFAAMIIMIEFRSPFSRTAKLIIPLSYFIIYQYGVISRPYALLMFAALLCASVYRSRREKPFRYAASLFLLCMCHSYGIALAGGIAVSDLAGEMFRKKGIKKPLFDILRNKKVLLAYSALLAAAIVIIAHIAPKEDTYAMAIEKIYGIPASFLLCYFFIPSEALVTSFSSDSTCMQSELNSVSELIATGIVSVLIWTVLVIICKKRRMLAEMIIPYFFLSVVMSLYVAPHHYGMFIIYALYIIWTASDIEPISISEFVSPLAKAGLSDKFAKKMICASVAAVAAINVYWDVYSYAVDIAKPYDPSRDAAEWIKENSFEDKKLMISWVTDDTNSYAGTPIAMNGYFSENLYYNMHLDLPYMTHMVADEEEIEEDNSYIRSFGPPDYIVCTWPLAPSLNLDPLGFDAHYIAEAYVGTAYQTFKSKLEENHLYVMCTRETYKELYGKEYEVPKY